MKRISTTQNLVLVSKTTTTALIAGLLFAYSCSVNPGLNRLSDSNYLAAMQSINRAILNPIFFVAFLGTAVLLPVSTYMNYAQPLSRHFYLLLAATIVYIVGVMGITMGGNVPLNEALNAVDLQSASASDMAAHRAAFEDPWNRLHTIRTVASILALILTITACLNSTNDQ